MNTLCAGKATVADADHFHDLATDWFAMQGERKIIGSTNLTFCVRSSSRDSMQTKTVLSELRRIGYQVGSHMVA